MISMVRQGGVEPTTHGLEVLTESRSMKQASYYMSTIFNYLYKKYKRQ